MNRPEAALIAFRGAQELRPDLRSYQGLLDVFDFPLVIICLVILCLMSCLELDARSIFFIVKSSTVSGLVRCYLALLKLKEALHAAREAMKAMPQSAKALKLVGDVHACNTSGREKVDKLKKFPRSYTQLSGSI